MYSVNFYRYFGILGIFLFSFLLWSIPLRAEIQLSGVEEGESLYKYLDETVLKEIREQDKEDLPRPVALRATLEKALNAKGYYNPDITYTDGENLVFEISTGPLYRLNKVKVSGLSERPQIELSKGDALEAESVLKAQKDLLKNLMVDACIFNLTVRHEILLDHAHHSADLTFLILGEEGAKFGETSFEGASDIDVSYLQKFLKYKDGDCWTLSKIESTRAALLETGLLSAADVTLPDTLSNSKIVPVQFKLRERAMKKIRLGGNFSTSEGPGVSAEWQHRNLVGSGEEFSVLSRFSSLLQSLGVEFSKPFFLSDKQSLSASAEVKREDTDAFEGLSISAQAALKRTISRFWSGSLGLALELSEIDEDNDTETFGLISVPGSLNYDSRDNALDPHKGFTLGIGLEPFIDAFGESAPFVKSQITGTTYFDLSDASFDPVLALRASLGTIFGAENDDIPATERFFAGGGGSIRGFGYQEAGPFDADDEPSGGRSLIETNTELRFKVTDKIGGVAFVDAGGVYESSVPDFADGFFAGAGVGARYFTDFGPVRFDIAVPVTERDAPDQNFQIYISIGQAF